MPRMNPTALSMYTAFGLLSTGALPVTAALRALEGDRTHRLAGRSLRTLARAIVTTTRVWDFDVIGEAPSGTFVVVANHASLADPFLLSYLPFDMRFVAKEELFKTPLAGWLLRLGGDIPLRRGNVESARKMSEAAIETLRGGLSVMIFPEGTRSKDGTLGRFRDGAFRIAETARVPILPVALHGTADCIGRGGPRRATARAEILAPIPPGRGFTALREETKAALSGALTRHARTEVVDEYLLGCPVEVAKAPRDRRTIPAWASASQS